MKDKLKYFILGLSVFLIMGFSSQDTGRYQMMWLEDRGQLLMLDKNTAELYEYDWTFNHWVELTFGSHIRGK